MYERTTEDVLKEVYILFNMYVLRHVGTECRGLWCKQASVELKLSKVGAAGVQFFLPLAFQKLKLTLHAFTTPLAFTAWLLTAFI